MSYYKPYSMSDNSIASYPRALMAAAEPGPTLSAKRLYVLQAHGSIRLRDKASPSCSS